MDSFNGIVFLAFLIFTSVHDTTGINCYDCEGDIGCDDLFDKVYNRNRTISSSDGWCWKSKGDLNGTDVVIGSGGPVTDASPSFGCTEDKCMQATVLSVTGDFCCCNTNLCNGGQRLAQTVSIFLIIQFFMTRY